MKFSTFHFPFLITLVLLLMVGGCGSSIKDKDSEQPEIDFKVDPRDFPALNSILNPPSGDTLIIKVQYDECGEWGGHRESMLIYLLNDSIPSLDFNSDSVVCEENDELEREKVVEKSLIIKEEDHKKILEFINALITQSLRCREDYWGMKYEVYRSSSNGQRLSFEFYDYNGPGIAYKLSDEYEALKNDLGISDSLYAIPGPL
jgi:hypothetical protein